APIAQERRTKESRAVCCIWSSKRPVKESSGHATLRIVRAKTPPPRRALPLSAPRWQTCGMIGFDSCDALGAQRPERHGSRVHLGCVTHQSRRIGRRFSGTKQMRDGFGNRSAREHGLAVRPETKALETEE